MPRLSVWFIRASLLYLVIGFTFGGLLLFNKGLPIHLMIWRLLPAHIESVMFGWTVQLVLGAAFWILPRFPKPPVRGNEALAWVSFILINIGIWFIVLAAFGKEIQWMMLMGRLAEAAGILAFVAHAWPRIKSA